jgi:hypothetical protein
MIESIKAYDEDNWNLITNDPENLAYKNATNILTRKKADMINNEFIKPTEESKKQDAKKLPDVGLSFEPIANSVILFLKDDSSFSDSIYKYDFNYTLPRWVFLITFLIFSGLLLFLIVSLIENLS